MIQLIGFAILFFSFFFLLLKIRLYLKIRRQRQGKPYQGFFVEFYSLKKRSEMFDYPHLPIFINISENEEADAISLITVHNKYVIYFWVSILFGTFLMCIGELFKTHSTN